MADPSTKSMALQTVYELTVPVHDLMGDAPTVEGNITVTLARADGRTDRPIFGPQGALFGAAATDTIVPAQRDASEISEGEWTFRLLPNDYYFVPTIYLLVIGTRAYSFTMPAEDSNLITLLDAESPAAGGGPGTDPPAPVLPNVVSVANASELMAAEGASGDPIFVLVTADFSTYHNGDLLVWTGTWSRLTRTTSLTPRSLGKLLAWYQTAGAVDSSGATESEIYERNPSLTLTHAGAVGPQSLYIGYPESLDDRIGGILVDGTPWSGTPLVKGAVETITGVDYRLWSVGGVDVSGGAVSQVELVLETGT